MRVQCCWHCCFDSRFLCSQPILVCLPAGLIAQALHELLLISNSTNGRSSSSTADAAPGAGSSVIKPQPLNATAATANSHNSLHHRVHERTLGAAGSSSSSAGAAAGSTSAGGAVPVGVVSAEELQGVNNVVRQVRCGCVRVVTCGCNCRMLLHW